MQTRHQGLTRGVLGGLAVLLTCSLAPAATGTTPVQGAGGGATADEYALKKDLGFQWTGDARARLDILDHSTSENDRVRFRTRVRVGAKGSFDSRTRWYFRLATGTDDPVSRNLTLAGGDADGNGMDFGLDQVGLAFKPTGQIEIEIGKLSNPHAYGGSRPWAAGEMVFDGDLTPPGANVDWLIHEGDDGDLFQDAMLTTGFYWIRENNSNPIGSDSWAWLTDIGSDIGPVEVGAGYYVFAGLNAFPGAGGGAASMGQAGNQTAGGMFIDDSFHVLRGSARYPFEIEGFPMAVRGEVIYNTSADDAQPFGWELRTEFPELGRGSGVLLVRDVGQNATFSPWADSDLGEGTGFHSGIEASYAHPITKNVAGEVSFYHHDRFQPLTGLVGPRSTNRIFFDVSGKF